MAAYEQFSREGSGASDVFLTGNGDPQPLKSLSVTGNLFGVLGVGPFLGRVFTDEETFEGKGQVVILSYGLWQSAFAGDPAIVGRTIVLSGIAYEVVGVMPQAFFFPGRDVQLWRPVAYSPSVFRESRRPHWLGVVARRKPRLTLAQATFDMERIARSLERQYPETNEKMGIRIEPLQRSLAHEARPSLLLLTGASALLFILVCANIANLQLGRALARAPEMAIRHALGARRVRLVRQLLIESLVLATIGGGLGSALAVLVTATLVRLAGAYIPVFATVEVDRSVLLCTVLLTLASPLLFGLLPAMTTSRSRSGRLNERGPAGSRRAASIRRALVAVEVALSIVLVVGSMLFLRSLVQLAQVDPGFTPDRVVAFKITLPPAQYPTPQAQLAAFTEIDRRIRNQPGVQAVAASSSVALRGSSWTFDLTVEGRAPLDGLEHGIRHASITADYFRTMGIRLLQGRMFDERDGSNPQRTLIVNDSFARKVFRGENPIGKRVRFGPPEVPGRPLVEVVGVVADERQDAMDRPAEPLAYEPIAQKVQNPLTFVMRTGLEPSAVVATARRQVALVDKDLALTSVATLQAVIDESLRDYRFRTLLLTSFATMALLLAGLGTYGVVAHLISQRSRELAIRQALGARSTELVRLVISQGLGPVAAGTVAGLGTAALITSFIESLLFGVRAVDPTAYAVAAALLACIGVAACAVPAWRATRADSWVLLRES